MNMLQHQDWPMQQQGGDTVDQPQAPTWVSSSVFMRRLASCSFCPPRAEQRESISSMKMTQGSWARAISNRKRTSFSDSPLRGEDAGRREGRQAGGRARG